MLAYDEAGAVFSPGEKIIGVSIVPRDANGMYLSSIVVAMEGGSSITAGAPTRV